MCAAQAVPALTLPPPAQADRASTRRTMLCAEQLLARSLQAAAVCSALCQAARLASALRRSPRPRNSPHPTTTSAATATALATTNQSAAPRRTFLRLRSVSRRLCRPPFALLILAVALLVVSGRSFSSNRLVSKLGRRRTTAAKFNGLLIGAVSRLVSRAEQAASASSGWQPPSWTSFVAAPKPRRARAVRPRSRAARQSARAELTHTERRARPSARKAAKPRK